MTFTQHLHRTLALALPVMLARAGLVFMIAVDTVIAGRAGADELAFLGVAMGPLLIMVTIGGGLLVGALVLTAQAHGAGRLGECGRIWRLSLLVAIVLGLLYAWLQWKGEGLLLSLGEDEKIARGGGQVLAMWAIGMPAAMLYLATASFLEGLSRPRAAVVVSLGANLVNLLLAWILVFGHAGLPAMGAAGAALASSLTLWLMFLLLGAYALAQSDAGTRGIRLRLSEHLHLVGSMLLLGLPVALSVGFETAAFSGASILAGWAGPVTLAAYQMANSVASLCYILTLGLATAATVRVGNAFGRADPVAMSRAGWIAAGFVLVLMLAAGLAIGTSRQSIAGVYSIDSVVIASAVPALGIIALLIVFDGIQTVIMGALRGAGDVVFPMAIYAIAFGGFALPLSYYFGYREGGGASGLVLGLGAGVAIAATVLGLRFEAIERAQIRLHRSAGPSRP